MMVGLSCRWAASVGRWVGATEGSLCVCLFGGVVGKCRFVCLIYWGVYFCDFRRLCCR